MQGLSWICLSIPLGKFLPLSRQKGECYSTTPFTPKVVIFNVPQIKVLQSSLPVYDRSQQKPWLMVWLSVFIVKLQDFNGLQPWSLGYVLSVAPFCSASGLLTETEMVRPTRPKIFTVCPFSGKVCHDMICITQWNINKIIKGFPIPLWRTQNASCNMIDNRKIESFIEMIKYSQTELCLKSGGGVFIANWNLQCLSDGIALED